VAHERSRFDRAAAVAGQLFVSLFFIGITPGPGCLLASPATWKPRGRGRLALLQPPDRGRMCQVYQRLALGEPTYCFLALVGIKLARLSIQIAQTEMPKQPKRPKPERLRKSHQNSSKDNRQPSSTPC